MRTNAPLVCLILTIAFASSSQGASEQDTLCLQAQPIADEYVRSLELTSWSMELGKWITRHGYQAKVDTFHQIDWFRWAYEQYCFKTRTESSGCTTEYSFFDNGNYENPRAILQQVVIIDGRTQRDGEFRQRVWEIISDSLTRKYGLPGSLPQDELLSPFNLGGPSVQMRSRLWQDGAKRIVLTEHFQWNKGVRTDFILLLGRAKALDSLVHRVQQLEPEYDPSPEICDSIRLTRSPLKLFCHPPDTSKKIALSDLLKCGRLVAERERAGDSAHMPLYRMALYVIGQSYVPSGTGDGPCPPDVDTLKQYGIIFEWNQLGANWHISKEPLIDVYTKYPNSRWGQLAFLFLQNGGWCLSGMCNGNNGPEVVKNGEKFLSRFPESIYAPAVLLTVAKGYETNWNVSTCDSSSAYMYDPKYRVDEDSRLKAIAEYERILSAYPDSREAEVAGARLPRLKLGVNTGRTEFFFIYD